jgi:hypothetical protein
MKLARDPPEEPYGKGDGTLAGDSGRKERLRRRNSQLLNPPLACCSLPSFELSCSSQSFLTSWGWVQPSRQSQEDHWR